MAADPVLIDRTLHALADGNRRAMVARLTHGPASVSELAAPLAISLPSALQHLDVLTTSGLVRTEKVGRRRQCHLQPAPLEAVERWVAEQRSFWEQRFDLLGEVLDNAYPEESK